MDEVKGEMSREWLIEAGFEDAICGHCSAPLQKVRPGKYQCVHCEERDALRAQVKRLESDQTALVVLTEGQRAKVADLEQLDKRTSEFQAGQARIVGLEQQLERAREALESILAQDEPWSLTMTLKTLEEAAVTLLWKLDWDGPGHEDIATARGHAIATRILINELLSQGAGSPNRSPSED